MSGINSRIAFRRSAATVAVAVAFLAVGATTAAQAAVGPYGPAHANCYRNGVVSTTLNFNKIGLGSQLLGWNVHYWDITKGRYTFTSGWHTFSTGYGMLGSPAKVSLQIDPGHYYVYTEYGWNQGSGWSVAGHWAGSYLTAGDFFGVPEGFCRAAPILTTVTGCANFGLATVACASRASKAGERPAKAQAKRVRRPESLRAIKRLQRSKAVRRIMRQPVPAPPSHTQPTESAAL